MSTYALLPLNWPQAQHMYCFFCIPLFSHWVLS